MLQKSFCVYLIYDEKPWYTDQMLYFPGKAEKMYQQANNKVTTYPPTL